MNVFVLRSVLPDVPLGKIVRGVFAFLVSDIVRLAIVIGFPALSRWLVGRPLAADGPRHSGA